MSEQQPIQRTSEGAVPVALVRKRRKRSGPKWLRRLSKRINLRSSLPKFALLLVVVVVVVVVVAGVIVTATINEVEDSIQSFNRVVSSLTANNGRNLSISDFDRLDASLEDVITTFNMAYSRARMFEGIVAINPDLQAGISQVGTGSQLARAARLMLEGLQPTIVFLFGEQSDDPLVAQISTGERIIELLSIGRPSFVQASTYLEAARTLLSQTDVSTMSPTALVQYEQLREYADLLSSLQTILVNSPEMFTSALGIGGQASYLVLAANSDEVRPSGGYVSTYGWLLVRNGRIEDYSYGATTDTSPNPPPNSMQDTYPVPDWWIRYSEPIYAAWDGSWTPDFPTTAEMAMWYYNNGNNPHSPVNGAISIDIVAFEYLLEALGQVSVPDYGIAVTPENFRDVIYDIRADFVEGGDRGHKAFLAAVYNQIFDEWQSRVANPEFSSEILAVLLRALAERHIMIHFTDPDLNAALDVIGWSGRQSPVPGDDYLMVVDANLGNKSNSSVRRQVIYDVELTPGGSAFSRATVLYDYSDSIAQQDPAVDERYHGQLDYVNLLQIYTPAGSVLDTTSGDLFNPQIVLTDMLTQFVSHLVVEYDTSERYQFSYAVPSVVRDIGSAFREYNLLIQKQPGMRAELVIIQVTLPEGARMVQVNPPLTALYSIEQQILEFRLDFVTDININVIYQ